MTSNRFLITICLKRVVEDVEVYIMVYVRIISLSLWAASYYTNNKNTLSTKKRKYSFGLTESIDDEAGKHCTILYRRGAQQHA